MRNRVLPIVVLLALVLTLTIMSSACQQAPAPTPAPVPAPTPAPTPAPAPVTPIKLTFGALYADGNPHTECDKVWIAKIEKETNGKVKIDYKPGATLVSMKDHFFEMVNGVVDISYGHVGTQPQGFDIKRASDPFEWGVPDEKMRMDVFNQWCAKYPEIPKEFSQAKALTTGNGMSYQLITKKPVRTVADLKGMKIRAMGAYGDWFKAMGGEGIPMGMGEVYLALQKGIVDGALAPYEVLYSNKFAEVTKYVTILNITLTPYIERLMNWNSWNKLPADVQKVFDANYNFWSEEMCRQFAAKNETGLKFGKEQGVEFIEPPAAAKAEFYKSLDDVCLNVVAKGLDAKGYKGSEMYKELRRLVDNYKK